MGKDAFVFPGQRKKTPFQRHKELEEERKKKEEAEAAKLYEEFVESFGEAKPEENSGPKAFLRGGTIQPGSSAAQAGQGQKKASSGKYMPSFLPPSMAAAPSTRGSAFSSRDSGFSSVSGRDSGMPLPSTSSRSDRSKPRNIDMMLENLKREQEAREERQRLRREQGAELEDDGAGSFDDGDPYTTNLYVGNLAPDVDEEVLKREFGRFGDIASVKIMWPRDDDQRRRGRNCGFVAFMTRAGADRAKADLNGVLLHDLELKLGWGKAVQVPPVPLYSASTAGGAGPMAASGGITPGKAAGAAVPPPGVEAAPPWVAPPHADDKIEGIGPDIVVGVPSDTRMRFIIDSMASYVIADGCAFEQAVMTAQAANPEFAFLFDLRCPEHAYYRWRLFSLASGDSLKSWRVEPFVMVEGGPRWVPPAMTAADGSHQTAAQRGGEAKDKDRPLSDLQRDKFEDLLRAITIARSDICEAMVFALDNAESASEVAETLADALTLAETPVPTKVARLMLVSDVLHNSTAPVRNASRYRSLLEAHLPDIFESLQETYRSVESRMAQESLRRHVLRVLRVWRSWFIFSDDFLNGLQATFLRGASSGGDAEGELAEELNALPDDELETRCRRNGLSRSGGRGAQVSRLLALHSYLHGEPTNKPHAAAAAAAAAQQAAQRQADNDDLAVKIAENKRAPSVFDVNTQPAPEPVKKPPEPEPIVSKWTLVDYDNEEEPKADEAKSGEGGDIFSDAEATPRDERGASPAPDPLADDRPAAASTERPPRSSPKPSDGRAQPSTGGAERTDGADEERRLRLRQVEVSTMLYRDELEEGGMAREDVDAAVAERRAELLAEAERDLDKAAAGKAERDRSARGSDKEKQRETDRPRDRERERERERDRDRDRERSERKRERSVDTRDTRDRENGSKRDHKEKDRPKDRDRDRDREDRDREREKDRERSRLRERDRDRSRSRSRERGRDRSRSKSRDRDRHRDQSRDRSRERAREKERERERELRERVREREREKEREKEKEKERERDREDRRREKEKEQKKRKDRDRSPERKERRKESKRSR